MILVSDIQKMLYICVYKCDTVVFLVWLDAKLLTYLFYNV